MLVLLPMLLHACARRLPPWQQPALQQQWPSPLSLQQQRQQHKQAQQQQQQQQAPQSALGCQQYLAGRLVWLLLWLWHCWLHTNFWGS
jgi:hypothetical protein